MENQRAINSTHGNSTARKVRDLVLCSSEKFWLVDDFEGTIKAVNAELSRLVGQEELIRVRRGVYWRGRNSRFGMGLPSGMKVLQKVLAGQQTFGATGWYATNLLGLSTQVSPVEMIAITGRVPSRIHNLKIVSRASRRARNTACLNITEVTFLEALDGWERYVEFDSVTALNRFIELLKISEIRINKIVEASVTEPSSVRERLRAVLLNSGHTREAEKIVRAKDPRTKRKALQVLGSSFIEGMVS
jgi:Family of unknown function (DUF6088)